MRPSRNGGCRIDRFDSSSGCSPWVSATMIEKIIVVAPTTAVPISTGLAVALNVLPAPSFSSRCCFASSKCGVEAEVALDLGLDAGDLLDGGELVDRLGVVGDRAIGIDRDRHRAHAEEAEGHEAEGEHGRREHQSSPSPSVLTPYATLMRSRIAMPSQKALKLPATKPERMLSDAPPSRELSDHLTDVPRVDGGEDLHQLRNDRAGQRAAGDDRRELPPQRRVAAEIRDQQVRHHVGQRPPRRSTSATPAS